MPDISATISIVDQFSTPLQEYAEAMDGAKFATSALASGLKEAIGSMQSISDGAIEGAIGLATDFIPSIHDTVDAAKECGAAFSEMIQHFSIDTILGMAGALVNFTEQVIDSAKKLGHYSYQIAKSIFFMVNGVSTMTMRVSTVFVKTMVNTYKQAFEHINSMVEKHIDAINLGDKLSKMYGDAGREANSRIKALANELGENAGEVAKAAADAASQGIGTDTFEQIYRLADRIGKLRPGQSTNEIVSNLVQSIKSGHDAETISGMLGGGDMMTRQLRRKGYERKLNHGDMRGALRIAKEVAEQAGYTEDKYKKAGTSLSENFKFMHNYVENLKKDLGVIYTKHFEPVVNKITKIMRSKEFNQFVTVMKIAIDRFGALVGGIFEGLVDNWKVFAFAVGAMLSSKALLAGRLLGIVWKFKGAIIGLAGGIAKLAWKFKALALDMLACVSVSKKGAVSMILANGKWVLIGAAVAGVVYGLHKILKVAPSVQGTLAGGYKFATNVFHNIALFFAEVIPNRIKYLNQLMKKYMLNFIGGLYQKVGDFFHWVIIKLTNLVQNTWLDDLLGEIGIDVSAEGHELANDFKDTFYDIGKGIMEKGDKALAEIEDIIKNETKYIDLMDGVKEAYDSNGASVVKWLKGLFNLEEKQGKGIGDINGQIKKISDQEEELRWLKAFSDRQITSQYNNMTSYSRTVNIHGMSNSGVVEMGRRSVSTIPSRAGL